MFVENFDKFINVLIGLEQTVTTAMGNTHKMYPNYGNMGSFYLNYNKSESYNPYIGRLLYEGGNSLSDSSGAGGVAFGTGDKAVEYTDATLSGSHVKTYTYTSVVTAGTDENGRGYVTAKYTLTNTAQSDITIKEVGLFVTMTNASSGSQYANRKSVMIGRAVLPSPVTLTANGGIGQVELTIRGKELTATA